MRGHMSVPASGNAFTLSIVVFTEAGTGTVHYDHSGDNFNLGYRDRLVERQTVQDTFWKLFNKI